MLHTSRAPSELPFGVSQYTTGSQPLAQDLTLLRRLGINRIEVCECKLPTKRLRHALAAIKDRGFEVASVQPRIHSLYPNSLRRYPEGPNERMAQLRNSIVTFARFFPGTTLVLNTGLAPRGDLASAWREREHLVSRDLVTTNRSLVSHLLQESEGLFKSRRNRVVLAPLAEGI